MTYLRVHWKGRPHYHPQIRVFSSTLYSGNRTIAQVAAEEVLRRPFSPPLIKARRRQVCKIFLRTRRSPNSRRSSSTIITIRKRTSRAKHKLQVYGWDSSTADVANLVQGRRPPSSAQISATIRPRSVLPAHVVVRNTTAIPSVDGAICSTLRRSEDSHLEKERRREVKVNFSNAPSHVTTNFIPPRITTQSPTASPLSTRPHSVYSGSKAGRHRTYDPRITLTNNLKGEQYLQPNFKSAGSRPSVTRSTGLRRPSRPQESSAEGRKQPTNSTAYKPPISMSVDKTNHKVPSQRPSNSAPSSTYRISISRTPSERRALRKFTKELERHLQTTRDLPQRASFASLPSITTTISIRTIADLEPYKSEFHAAGLAITSHEQRGMAFGWSSKNKRAATPPPIANTPERSRYEFENVKSSQKPAREPSYASGSTGTTVMGFTPPHEKTYDAPRAPIQRRHSSSNHTIVGFTPPHEMEDRIASSSPKQSTRKSLPWLRKQESLPPGLTLVNQNSVQKDDVIKEMRIADEQTRSSSFSPSPRSGEERKVRQSPGENHNTCWVLKMC